MAERTKKRRVSSSEDEEEEYVTTKNQIFVEYNQIREEARTWHHINKNHKKSAVDRSIIDSEAYLELRLKAFQTTQFRKIAEGSSAKTSDLTLATILKDPSYDPEKLQPSNRNGGKFQRLLLCKDLSDNSRETYVLPVWCDLGHKSTDHVLSTEFWYAKRNSVSHPSRTPQGRFKIQCSCIDGCEPATCACIQLQKAAFKDMEHVGGGIIRDSFDYHKANYLISTDVIALVMCGPLCACPPSCRNHIAQLKNTHRFEVFRRDMDIGFSLRTMNNIEMDEVAYEFVGNVNRAEQLESKTDAIDYSMELCGSEICTIMDPICKALGIKDEELELYDMEKYQKERKDDEELEEHQEERKNAPSTVKEPLTHYFINPYKYGNLARFATHGCFPNVVPFRVICNYIHPYYHRIFFKAVIPIPAGSEIYFNYGADYMQRAQLKCRCRNLMCESDPKSRAFWDSMSADELMGSLKTVVAFYKQVMRNKVTIYKRKNDKGYDKLCPLEVITLSDSEEGNEQQEQKVAKEEPKTIKQKNMAKRRKRDSDWNAAMMARLDQQYIDNCQKLKRLEEEKKEVKEDESENIVAERPDMIHELSGNEPDSPPRTKTYCPRTRRSPRQDRERLEEENSVGI